jgi:hypothetical protein
MVMVTNLSLVASVLTGVYIPIYAFAYVLDAKRYHPRPNDSAASIFFMAQNQVNPYFRVDDAIFRAEL